MLKAFTLIETLTVIGVLSILALIIIPIIDSLQSGIDFDNTVQEIISVLNLARNKTIASEGPGQWGVFFSTSTNQYVLFQGTDYYNRTVSSDKIYKLSEGLEFSEVNFQGQEVVFNSLNGRTDCPGSLALEGGNRTGNIYVSSSGLTFLSGLVVSDDERIKDSRHVHIDYSRPISTSTEKIILDFDEGVQQEIIIADNIISGQFFWQGEIEVFGSVQKLKIETHELTAMNAEFSIHRDRRYNDKALNIDITGDPSYPAAPPTLIRYEADGNTVSGNSIYVSEPIWQ